MNHLDQNTKLIQTNLNPKIARVILIKLEKDREHNEHFRSRMRIKILKIKKDLNTFDLSCRMYDNHSRYS